MNTTDQTPTTEAPATEAPAANEDMNLRGQTMPNAALKLGPKYDTALLGATIKGEFVYSLSKLTDIETTEEVTREQAQAYIAEQVIDVTRQWGDTAPVFVDDTLFVAPVEIDIIAPDERPRILLPRGI